MKKELFYKLSVLVFALLMTVTCVSCTSDEDADSSGDAIEYQTTGDSSGDAYEEEIQNGDATGNAN